jgi:hypothetical protein
MSVLLEINYSKKVGLPNYSSHSHSVTVRTELADLSSLEKTNAELYARLQSAVDSQIVNAGHLPAGNTETPARTTNGTAAAANGDAWACSPKQREFIQKIIGEHQLNPADIEKLASDRFKTGLRSLNKVQASALIDELIETHGSRQQGRGGQRTYAGRGRS